MDQLKPAGAQQNAQQSGIMPLLFRCYTASHCVISLLINVRYLFVYKHLQNPAIALSIRRLRKYESQASHCVFCYNTLNVVTTVGPQIVLKQLERIPDYE